MTSGLTDPAQPSYAAQELIVAAAAIYWLPVLAAPLMYVASAVVGEHQRVPRLFCTVPFLLWAFWSSVDLLTNLGLPSYYLWHRFVLSLMVIAFISAEVAILYVLARRVSSKDVAGPNSVWCAAVLIAPLADWALAIFLSSPIEAVLR
jgi:hypothetical protein